MIGLVFHITSEDMSATIGHKCNGTFVSSLLALVKSFGRKHGGHGQTPFSFPEAVLLLVSTKNRDLWPSPTTEVRDSRTSRHSAHVQSQV